MERRPARCDSRRCALLLLSQATVDANGYCIAIVTPNHTTIMHDAHSVEMTGCERKHKSWSSLLASRQQHGGCFSHDSTFSANLHPCGALYRPCTCVVSRRQHRGPSFRISPSVRPPPLAVIPTSCSGDEFGASGSVLQDSRMRSYEPHLGTV